MVRSVTDVLSVRRRIHQGVGLRRLRDIEDDHPSFAVGIFVHQLRLVHRALFTSTTVPLIGAKISLTAFTDSTVPIGSPRLTVFPIGGSSTYTTSVSRS